MILFNYKTDNNIFEIESHTEIINTKDIISDYDYFSNKCKEGCKNFNTKYSCPPSSPKFENLMLNYEYMVVNMLKINMDKHKKEYNTIRMSHVVLKSIQRKTMDKVNIGTEHMHLANGACKGCKKCAKCSGETCRHIDKKRFSLESTGINVNDLLIKAFKTPLQWYTKGRIEMFPEYQVICSGILIEHIDTGIVENINSLYRSI